MTCIDANVFLRALTEPTTSQGRLNQAAAQQFFERVHSGHETYTATLVAIHETFYALTAKRTNGYGQTPDQACARMRPLLELPGFRHRDKQVIIDTISLWIEHPTLGFSDAFTAVVAMNDQLPLMSFDADFDGLEGLERYRPLTGRDSDGDTKPS